MVLQRGCSMLIVIVLLVAVAWVVLPLPLAFAVGRAFHLGGTDGDGPRAEAASLTEADHPTSVD
jgi:hypothetical protein